MAAASARVLDVDCFGRFSALRKIAFVSGAFLLLLLELGPGCGGLEFVFGMGVFVAAVVLAGTLLVVEGAAGGCLDGEENAEYGFVLVEGAEGGGGGGGEELFD